MLPAAEPAEVEPNRNDMFSAAHRTQVPCHLDQSCAACILYEVGLSSFSYSWRRVDAKWVSLNIVTGTIFWHSIAHHPFHTWTTTDGIPRVLALSHPLAGGLQHPCDLCLSRAAGPAAGQSSCVLHSSHCTCITCGMDGRFTCAWRAELTTFDVEMAWSPTADWPQQIRGVSSPTRG